MPAKKIFTKPSKSVQSVLLSFFSQFSNSAINFILIPVLLEYLNKDNYGLWITLVSLVNWIFVSDFGVGQAFRNRVTAYLADRDKDALNKHFRITFQYYCILACVIFLFFLFVLNNNEILVKHKTLSLIIYLPYILYFPFSIGTQVLQGLRLVHLTGVLTLLRAVLWGIFIACLVFVDAKNDLLHIAVGYSIIQTIINCATIYLALKKSDIRLPTKKEMLTKLTIDETLIVGFKFFILQVSGLILYTMGNYFVYSNLSASATATYDTVNRVYSLYMTFFSIIISVFWSEIAFFRKTGDFGKLNSIYKKLLSISVLFCVGSIAVAFITPIFIKFWTHGKIDISLYSCIPFSFLVSVQAISYVGTVFLNAFEEIKTQVIVSVLSIVLVYPLVKLGFRYDMGIGAVPIVCGTLVVPALICAHYVAIRLIKVPTL